MKLSLFSRQEISEHTLFQPKPQKSIDDELVNFQSKENSTSESI